MNNSIKWIALILTTLIICITIESITVDYFNHRALYFTKQKEIQSIQHSIHSHNIRLMQLEQKELVQESYKNPSKKITVKK